MAKERAPSYEELCRRYGGLKLPRAFHGFVVLAHEIDPEDPSGAFDPIGIISLNLFDDNDDDERGPGDDGRCPDTPAEVVVFGDAEADGAHYGFLVDDESAAAEEYPIVDVFPDNEVKLVGSTFRDFLEHRLLIYLMEEDEPDEDLTRVAKLLESRLGVRLPGSPEEADKLAEDAEKRFVEERLATRNVISTADGLGVVLPPESVDRGYLAGLRWPKKDALKPRPDESILAEAERRLARGEHGTALVLARNFRTFFWYSDWKTGRNYIRRTAAVLEKAYAALGRSRAAANIRRITHWAVKEVQ